MDLSVVIVTWNSGEHLPACLGALVGELPPSSEVIVVDNASSDNSVAIASKGDAKVIANTSNEGFGRACNRGASEATGNVLLFLNPDAVVEPHAIKTLRRALVAAPRVGAAGGALVNPDGSPQSAADDFITASSLLRRVARQASGSAAPRRASPAAGAVDWVFGAFLMVRRDAFEEAGGFDARYHMYYEDMDLCWRLHERGWTVRFEPRARATHVGGASAAYRWDGFPGAEKARSLLKFQQAHASPSSAVAFRITAAAAYASYAAVRAVARKDARPWWDAAKVFVRGG